jgi:ABC-type nitrate/sulfonate/bicarbonate transport system substrate-binding protein
MGYTQFSAAVAGIEKGVPITIIAVPTPRDASGIVYLESTGIQEWEDLEGKQVGNFPAGNTGAIVRSALETSGVDPNLVNFVNIQPGSEMSLLTAGRLEVLAGLAGAQDLWLRCSGVAAGSLPAYEAGVELFGQVVVANNSWMEEVGDEAVSKALLGIIKGFGLLKTEPEKALDQMNQLQPDAQTNLAQELASMDPEQGYTGWMMEGGASASTKGFAWIDEEQMQTSLDELARAGLAQAGNSENLDKFATTKYLEDPDVQRAALEVSDADFAPIDKSIREQCKLS